MEVYNKIDLLSPSELDRIEDLALTQEMFPIIPMSAIQGTNKIDLISTITEMSNDIFGIDTMTLTYPFMEHDRRVSWLFARANIPQFENFQ